MSFDGVFLHKLIKELECLKSGRISKIMESGDTDFVFTIRANHENYNLLLGFSCDYARIHITTKAYDFPANPKSLTMFLRKHLEGFFIEDIFQYHNDRIVVFKLAGYSEMKDYTSKYFICEIMGRYSNFILTDDTYHILEVLKHTGVTEFGRTMLPNALYQFPIAEKKNPFDLTFEEFETLNLHSPKEVCQALEGISMGLAEYAFTKEQAIPYLYELLHQEIQPTIYLTNSNKLEYYYIPLSSVIKSSYTSLSSLLDNYYYEADKQAKIKQKTNDLASFIQKQIQKNERKLQKLKIEASQTAFAEEYKIKGDLLLSYPHLKSKEAKVSVYNYYTNQEEVITLDAKYDVITNSQRFYKKYQKTKTAIKYIEEQMQLASDEIEYLSILFEQLKTANINDALEIQQELLDNRYLINQVGKQKKKTKPNFLTYIVEDTLLYVGKNNLQNEYITHKLAKPSQYWFHVQKASGSHVVCSSEQLTESLIRTAAMLAAMYSSLSGSSSIPVDYTQVKNIKKIPGKKNCFVTYTKQKTIYIDVDTAYIESLRIKK